jgi:hypothetical protein
MPRAIHPNTPLDAVEEEILYTRAALDADEDAREFLPQTDAWLPDLDKLWEQERDLRHARALASAKRAIANQKLDRACTAFGDDLLRAVNKDRSSPRWATFFPASASQFVRTPLPKQLQAVRAWLTSADPALSAHRAELERWSQAAQEALDLGANLAVKRGALWQAREELAHDLTAARDGLAGLLAVRSQERLLGRDWAATFFIRESRPDAEPKPE